MYTIEELKRKKLIWNGFKEFSPKAMLPSGFPELDDQLRGGLPEQGVMELTCLYGIGELRLVSHYLTQKQEHGLVVIINPPCQMSAEFFLQQKLDLNKILIIKELDANQSNWCVEQCLKSGCCSVVLLWTAPISVAVSRRFILATEQNNASLLMFTPINAIHAISTPISLKLQLQPETTGLSVNVLKQKGGYARNKIHINYQTIWPELTVSNAKVSPHSMKWHSKRKAHH